MPRFGRQFGRTLQAGRSHASLLFLLLLLIVAAPLVTGQRSDLVVEMLFNLVLLGGVYSVGPTQHRTPFLLLTVLTLGMRWGEKLSGIEGFDITALVVTLAWMVYAISIIVAHLFQRREVTLNTILGAVVTYLLAALAFARYSRFSSSVSLARSAASRKPEQPSPALKRVTLSSTSAWSASRRWASATSFQSRASHDPLRFSKACSGRCTLVS